MTKQNDLEYIRRIKAGETNVFSYIVSRYHQMVLTIIVKITNNREDAEDITQEVFIKVFKALDQFKEEAEFSTWLYRIAYNTTLSELRRKKLIFTSYEENLSDGENSPEFPDDLGGLETEERLQYLDRALKALAPDEAWLISLFYLNEQSIEKISQVSGLSQANVKVKLHRIRKKLACEINKLMAE